MKHWKWFKRLVAIAAIVLISCTQMSRSALAASKPATPTTIAANEKVLKELPFENTEDFELATKGFIDKLPDPVLIPLKSNPDFNVWNLKQYQFLLDKELDKERVPAPIPTTDPTKLPPAPPTVNPSLWRMSQLNMQHGLYKVVPGIYQIRGYDLTVMTLVEGDTGWIVIDPLTSNETAKAALDLANKNIAKMELVKHPRQREPLPISAIIYTHSHVDHYAGVKGIIDSALVKSQTNPKGIKIYAPEGFLENAISENVFAGNVMSRRATYMFGPLIPKNKKGQVDGGLGKTSPNGTVSLIAPTELITYTSDPRYEEPTIVDEVEIFFQNAPNTEAPSEMMFYFPQFKALCTAENATRTLHNILTPRGARVRDPLVWAKYLNETIELFGKDVEVVFATHHWPTWDKPETPENEVVEYLKKHRDLYKYIHDQTLRLANQGYTMLEIAEMLELPSSLSQEWYNRDYYGTLNFNVKAVYQRYLGWFNGNPALLYSLPPEEAGAKYVEYMGGARAAIEKAKNEFANGEEKDYRWVAQVMNDVVFGTCKNNPPPYDPKTEDIDTKICLDATQLEADALEQLGYQTESAVWRNFFLTGALELRKGVNYYGLPSAESASPDTIAQMTTDLLFDTMAIRLNGWEARDRKYIFKMILPDTNERYLLFVENGVLNYTDNLELYEVEPNTTIVIDRTDLNKIFEDGRINPENIICSKGNLQDFEDFQDLLDKFEFWFNIVLP